MLSLCCKQSLQRMEANEASYLVCGQCGAPCDKVVSTYSIEALKDEQI